MIPLLSIQGLLFFIPHAGFMLLFLKPPALLVTFLNGCSIGYKRVHSKLGPEREAHELPPS